MDPKIIGILIGLVLIIACIIFLYFRKKKIEEYADTESKIFLSDLTSSIVGVIDDYLTMDNFKKVIENHYLDDFADSENYIMNIVVNDLYEKLYDFILEELEKMSHKDNISKAMYKLIKNSRNIPDSSTYNFLFHILDSDSVKHEIDSLTSNYWEEYKKQLDELEDKHSNISEDEYIENLEDEPSFEPEKEDPDEINEEEINPPSDEEIPFDENIDEVIEEGEEEVSYFFDSKGRKRDKKTGRYTK